MGERESGSHDSCQSCNNPESPGATAHPGHLRNKKEQVTNGCLKPGGERKTAMEWRRDPGSRAEETRKGSTELGRGEGLVPPDLRVEP